MSEDEILVEYLGRTTPIKKSPSFQEFISQLAYKFFLTEKMKNEMKLIYYDEDNDEIKMDNDNYSLSLSEAEKIFLKIPEKSKPQNNQGGIDGIKEEVKKKMGILKNDIDAYKNKLKEICKNTIEKKLKEVDDKHKNELEEFKKKYEGQLNNIKTEALTQIEAKLIDIEKNSTQIMNDKLTEYSNYIEKEIEKLVKSKEESLAKKIDEVNFENLEKKQSEVGDVLMRNQEELVKGLDK